MDVNWMTSPWDQLVHAFQPEKIGEVTAQAVCTHSALASHLTDPAAGDRPCLACLLIHGDQLADQLEPPKQSGEPGADWRPL